MKLFLAILLTGILTENFVLSKFLGICPFLGVSKKLNTAVGMSAAVIVQLVEITLKWFLPALYNSLGIYLPLITTNCAVLGVVLLNIDKSYGFWQSIVNSLGAGLGFMLAMVLFAGVRERLESCEVPKFLQGLPITLIAASLVSVSFLGFTGIVEGMFH